MNAITRVRSTQEQPVITENPAEHHVEEDGGLAVDLADVLDITNLLFAVENEQQGSQESEREAAIRAQVADVKATLERIREAAEKAREDAEKSSVWSDIASVAKVVAAVASVAAGVAGAIGSGGLSVVGGLAIAGALLSVTAKPIIKELGGDDTAVLIGELAGAGLSLGLGVASIATAGAKAAAQGGQAVATGVQSFGRTARVASLVIASGAVATQGYGDAKAGIFQADSVDAQADGMTARAQHRLSQARLDEMIQALKELEKSFQRAKSSLIDAQGEVANTNKMLVTALGR